jgi:NAD(P)-dependent dehydrogenase (short-subunit alcohol dehydrogenase family)
MNKTILITGSSSGIGKATVKYFAEQGWSVVATMRTPEKEKELTKLGNVFVTRLDVQDHDSIKYAIKDGINKFGKIDALLNNAGYGAYGPLETFSDERIRRQFDVNVVGLLNVTKEIIPHFRENKNGILINISSIGGKIAFPFGSLYHGTKFAVEGFSEALSYEFKEIGCKVKIVEPGAIRTDFGGRSFDFANDESLKEYQGLIGKIMKATQPMLENGSEPIVVAKVIYEAATDGTDKLRYTAGEDAKQIVGLRKQLDDEEFIQNVKSMMKF